MRSGALRPLELAGGRVANLLLILWHLTE